HDLTTRALVICAFLAVDGMIIVDFAPVSFSRHAQRHWHDLQPTPGRPFHPVRGRASVFLAIPPQRTVLFSGSFLLSLAVPPSQGRRSRWTGSIWVLLERNPPKRPLVPGGALPLGRESNPAPHKKGTICHQNTLREKKNAAAASNQPVKTFRLGRIKAAVWENEGEQKFYSVTFARTYVDEANKYHDTDSFGRDDLPLVAKL